MHSFPRQSRRKMAAEDTVSEVQRKRKSNFSAVETSVLVEKYEENKDILDSKLTNQITRKQKSGKK